MLSIYICFPYKNSPKIGLIILRIRISDFTRGKIPESSQICRSCISTSFCFKIMWQIVWRYNSSLSYLHLCCSPYPSLAPCTNFEIFCFSILLLLLAAVAPCCCSSNRGVIFIITEIHSTYVYKYYIRISHCLERRVGDTDPVCKLWNFFTLGFSQTLLVTTVKYQSSAVDRWWAYWLFV